MGSSANSTRALRLSGGAGHNSTAGRTSSGSRRIPLRISVTSPPNTAATESVPELGPADFQNAGTNKPLRFVAAEVVHAAMRAVRASVNVQIPLAEVLHYQWIRNSRRIGRHAFNSSEPTVEPEPGWTTIVAYRAEIRQSNFPGYPEPDFPVAYQQLIADERAAALRC